MNRNGYFSVIGVAVVSIISGYILWQMFLDVSSPQNLGLGGVFAASLLSHATMVARDIFVPLFLAMTPFYSPLMLGLSAGVGGAIGDLAPYVLGLGMAESLKDEKSRAGDLVSRWIQRYGLWAILIVAMTPLPDLPIVMLAGTRKLSLKRLLALEAAGKTVLYTIGAYFGGRIFEILIGAVGSFTASSLMVVGSIIFCILVTWPPSRDYLFGYIDKFIPS